jgi:biopolymer transport protein TolR
MARTFRRPRQLQPIAELNVTNLIDLGFTLLIIFMIATPLITQDQSIAVNLPLESKSQQAKPDPSDTSVSVTVKTDGTYSLDMRQLALPQLLRELDALAKRAKPPIVHVRLDGKAIADDWVKVLDRLKTDKLRAFIDTRIAPE